MAGRSIRTFTVLPHLPERLRAKLPPAYIATRVLKVAIMGESLVDSRVAPIYKRYTDVQTTILAGAGDVQFNLFTRAASMEEAQQRVDELAGEIEDELEDAVYSSKGESLALAGAAGL